MRVDIGPALAETATPGVPTQSLAALDERVGSLHERITDAARDRAFGYAALSPDPPLEPIRAVAAEFPDASSLVVVGIGGSALPAGALAEPLLDAFPVRLLDNADPTALEHALNGLDLDHTVINVVSRSGRTAETLANFRAVSGALERAGVSWMDRTVITTGPEGPLRSVATTHDLPTLPAPEAVPGRFGIFSAVGLFPLVLGGADVDSVLDGARAVADDLAPSVERTPSYAFAATLYALDQRGADGVVLWGYDDRLRTFVEWTAQLFAESLGKDGLGVTPIRARGTTDQHAHLQLYRAGPRDKVVTFLSITDRESGPPPVAVGDVPAYLEDTSLVELQDAAREATVASLVKAGRPSVDIAVPNAGPAAIGGVALSMMATTIALGELYGIETFDQPAVEWGKRAARGLLGDPDCADAAEAVRNLPSKPIEGPSYE